MVFVNVYVYVTFNFECMCFSNLKMIENKLLVPYCHKFIEQSMNITSILANHLAPHVFKSFSEFFKC